MKKMQFICISLALMLSLVSGLSESALNYLTTTSNMDNNSCLLNLTYTVHARKVVFEVDQYIPDPINRSCTYQDIVTAPIFYNVPFTPVSLNLQPTAGNPNHLKATFTWAQFKAAWGSACVDVGVYSGETAYTCRFKFSSVYFYLDLWLVPPENTTFDNGTTGVLFIEHSAMESTKYGFDIWVPNPSFPHIVGRTQDGCGANNWDNIVNSLSTAFTVMGTEYLSNTLDLHDYLNGTTPFAVVVKKNGAAPKNYRMVQISEYYGSSLPFDTPATGNCTDLEVTYGSILPNLNYCSNGCAISVMLFTEPQAYVLMTDGIQTAPNRLRV